MICILHALDSTLEILHTYWRSWETRLTRKYFIVRGKLAETGFKSEIIQRVQGFWQRVAFISLINILKSYLLLEVKIGSSDNSVYQCFKTIIKQNLFSVKFFITFI